MTLSVLLVALLISEPNLPEDSTRLSQLRTPVSEHFGKGLRDFTSARSLTMFSVGSAFTAAAFLIDDPVRNYFRRKNRVEGWRQIGNIYGDYPMQFGIAVSTLGIGLVSDTPELTHFGEAAFEGHFISSSLDLALKYSVRRDRPNGGQHSFPSGHATRAFTTAGVLWNTSNAWISGLSITLGTLTLVGRLASQKHYLSDVLAGATLGFVTGYAWSRHHSGESENSSMFWIIPFLESRKDFGLIAKLRF